MINLELSDTKMGNHRLELIPIHSEDSLGKTICSCSPMPTPQLPCVLSSSGHGSPSFYSVSLYWVGQKVWVFL